MGVQEIEYGRGLNVSFMSRIAEALGLLSPHVPVERPDMSEEERRLRDEIQQAKERRERCEQYLSKVVQEQVEEGNRVIEAVKGVIAKLDQTRRERDNE